MMKMTGYGRNLQSLAAMVLLTGSAALGGGVPDYDFEWVTIGDPGNEPYQGEIFNIGKNRGGVDYTYRMSKLETTSGQWLEFIRTAGPLLGDVGWGEPKSFGYLRFGPGNYVPWTPNPDMTPVQGIQWREAAMYANWLHNDKANTVEALMDGAYDVSTFGEDQFGVFTDQATHHPDAKFWIPTLDEWIKAVHYDPNKGGPGESGWWQYPTTSDTAPIEGPPGEGETSGYFGDWIVDGVEFPSFAIPLGAYPDVTSPWGLLDTSGGASEWTEEIFKQQARITEGRYADYSDDPRFDPDTLLHYSLWPPGNFPSFPKFETIRLASAIPAPSSFAMYEIGCGAVFHWRKRCSRNRSV